MYVILQDSRDRIDYAPANWLKRNEDGTETIYWPKNDLTRLQSDPHSEPVTKGPDRWLIVKDTVKRRNIPTKEEANAEVERMQCCSVTEDSESEVKVYIKRQRPTNNVDVDGSQLEIQNDEVQDAEMLQENQ